MIKKKVLRITTTLDPKFGGPSVGVLESSKNLIKSGFKVDIITLDKKKFNQIKLKNLRIINFKNYFGKNYRFSISLFFWLLKNKKNYNYFIIHGLWQFPSLLARLVLKNKYYVYTHGQLDPFFGYNFIKSLKKKLYWYLIEYKNLQSSISIILTSLGEKKNLEKTFVKTNELNKKIIKYGIYKKKLNYKKIKSLFLKKYPYLKTKNFYLYIGRFNEKKGCDIIIKSVNKLKKQFKTPILFVGPFDNNNYEIYIKKLVSNFKLNKLIFFSDAIFGDLKWGTISNCKAMLLASHGENFGISVVESLSVGRPVIITNKVNIYRDILMSQSGLISDNTTKSFGEKLLQFEKLNKKEIKRMSQNSIKCFKKNFELTHNDDHLSKLLLSQKL